MLYCCSMGMTHHPVPYMFYGLHAISTGVLRLLIYKIDFCTTFVFWSDYIDGVKNDAIHSENHSRAVVTLFTAFQDAYPA